MEVDGAGTARDYTVSSGVFRDAVKRVSGGGCGIRTREGAQHPQPA